MSDSQVSVNITHRAPGIQPPLYIAGSFSNPQWVPEPMEYTTDKDGVYTFTKTVRVKPNSSYQYKYRVGETDWWILNEDAPIATDDAGNRNNLLDAPAAPAASIAPEVIEASEPPLEEQYLNEEPVFEHTKLAAKSDEANTEDQHETSTFAEDTLHVAVADADAKESQPKAPSISQKVDLSSMEDASAPIKEQVLEEKVNGEPSEPTVEASSDEPLPMPLPLPVSKVEALKQSEHIEREMTNTPRIADEVADSAALLDCPTPEPEALAGVNEKVDEELPSISPVADIADKAAEADIAAEVADTAETLDAEEPETEQMPVVPSQNSAETAAEVADTAETLDADESELHLETPPSAYKNLADVKASMRDDSLDIAGYSNDPEPVALFAHECAGLYEDDEIPGVEDVGDPRNTHGRLFAHGDEDFDDPTLERFPSTKSEIVSAVRKVETGLNEDQTSVEGVPLSPLVRSRHSSTADIRGDHNEPGSPTSTRAQQTLSLPPPLSQQSLSERSLSAVSLHSIAEDAEGDEPEKPDIEAIAAVVEPMEPASGSSQPEDSENAKMGKSISEETAPVVEETETADEMTQLTTDTEDEQAEESAHVKEDIPAIVEVPPVAEEAPPTIEKTETADEHIRSIEEFEGEEVQNSKAEEIAPVAEKAETADEVIQLAKEAEGEVTLTSVKPTLQPLVTVPSPSVKPNNSLLSPVSDDDEAVVLRNGKAQDKGTESSRPGYLTPERAATPKPEEPGSPREPAPNAADPVAEPDLGLDVSKADVAPAPSEPRSPRIVVSKAEEAPPTEELLPAPSLSEEGLNQNQVSQEDSETSKNNEAPREAEASTTNETAPSDHGVEETGSHTETTAASSALDQSQASSLKKRSVARPNPAERADTPTSITDTHREAAKSGNWFSAFFRLIFIDFVGGLVSRLCGGRRKTLATTVVVLVAVGIAAYRMTSEAGGESNKFGF